MSRLDRPLPQRVRVALLVVACLLPASYVLKQSDAQAGCTRLIFFGKVFLERALPEVREAAPAADSEFGFDGQFYAQIGLDPLLHRPAELKHALDSPELRVQRILLPMISYAAGLGRPAWILSAYALLNPIFWYLLLWGLVHYLRPASLRDFLCLAAIVFTTGALISIQRALTDLPAATLGFFAAAWTGAAAAGAIAMAAVIRETSVLFLPRLLWPLPPNRAAWLRLGLLVLLALTPKLLWMFYMRLQLGGIASGANLFGVPLGAWGRYMALHWQALGQGPFVFAFSGTTPWEYHLFEIAAGISILFQAGWLIFQREIASPYWRMGIAVAVMFPFLSEPAFEQHIAFTRYVLPMTIAFNIALMQRRGAPFLIPFAMGNFGLCWSLKDMLGAFFRP